LESLKFLANLSDMTMPQNWYPQARSKKRTIFYHMGPTNSGKTNQAIQSLIKAKTGIYCAPLRLLAWEIGDKLLNNNIKCTLKTGQECVEVENATHYSCTIEMCPTTTHYDVAVIDEIQLISDPYRGFAWTNAFLGLIADEIHLCGDERALNLIYKLCETTGDKLIKKTYTRLSDLVVEDNHLHSVSQLQKGDCIVSFSKKDIFKLKNLINEKSFKPQDIPADDDEESGDDSGKNNFYRNKCAVIYGSLPPETKKQQAVLFNNFDKGIKYLVATDAIGMGLNLNIKRVIFASISKRDAKGHRRLTEYEVRQIAGRAGRSNNRGFVTAFKKHDLEYIRTCCSKTKHKKSKRTIKEQILYDPDDEDISSNYPPFEVSETLIEKACLFPPLQTIIDFSEALLKFNKNNSSKIKKEKKNSEDDKNNQNSEYISFASTLKKFELLTNISELFFVNDLQDYYEKHKVIEDIKDADIRTQYYFTICPIKLTSRTAQHLLFFLTQLVKFKLVKLPQSFHLENKIFMKNSYKLNELTMFEEIYNSLEVYVWLSYKFEKEFIERELAKVLKDRLSKIIESIIQHSKFNVYSDLRNEEATDSVESEEDNEFTNSNSLKNKRKLLQEDLQFYDLNKEED